MRRIVLSQHLFLFHKLVIVRVLSRLNSRWTSKGKEFIKTGMKQKAFKARLSCTKQCFSKAEKFTLNIDYLTGTALMARAARRPSAPSGSRTCCWSYYSKSLSIFEALSCVGAGAGRGHWCAGNSQQRPGKAHALFIQVSGTFLLKI